jgi:hypothetical protein
MALFCFAILARRIGDGRGFGMTLRTCIFGREERNGMDQMCMHHVFETKSFPCERVYKIVFTHTRRIEHNWSDIQGRRG